MTVDYNRLDEIYKEVPEIRDLIKAAAWVAQEGYHIRAPEKRMSDALTSLRKAGMALDNRNL
jgi:hypothetical protein